MHQKTKLAITAAVMVIAAVFVPIGSLAAHPGLRPLAGPLPWSEPVNVSQSGGAANPRMVVDSTGVVHAVWDDVYAESVYAHSTDDGWSVPVAMDLPIAGREAELIADGSGGIHALWLDDDRVLNHQRVNASDFGSIDDWQPANVLAVDVANFDGTLDSQDRLQVAYVRMRQTDASPAGIYTLRSNAGGITWSSPASIYLSPYFRTLVPPERTNAPSGSGRIRSAHVDIETTQVAGSTWIYVAWDHPALKRVYLTSSPDNGENWLPPQIIDAVDAASPYELPQQIRVSAAGPELLAFWQVSLAGGSCSEVYQASSDGGVTWDVAGSVFDGASSCAESLQVLSSPDGNLVLLVTLAARTYLLAWDGNQWSRPQADAALVRVLDPVTLGFVELGCLRAAASVGRVFVLACDRGAGNGDIWFTTRDLGDIDEWFAASTNWSRAEPLPLGPDAIVSLALSAQAGGAVHALWSQASTTGATDAVTTIFYAAVHADQFSGPFPALTVPGREISQFNTAIDAAGRLLFFWVDSAAAFINFNWADARYAGTPASWSSAQSLPVPAAAVGSPQIAFGSQGEIYFVYGVPINEGRGVYLLNSTDRGATWSAPTEVFLGSSDTCALIQEPRLAVTDDGQLHALWTCANAPGSTEPVSLFQSRSGDGGQTWSRAEQVAEGRVAWSELAAAGAHTLHRIWQESSAAGTATWHALSTDSGTTWARRASISVGDHPVGPASIAADADGGLHLLQFMHPEGEGAQFRYWYWNGRGWEMRESLPLENVADPLDLKFDTLVDSDGHLVIVYAQPAKADADGQVQHALVYASRPIGAAGLPGPSDVTPGTTQTPAAAPVDATAPASTLAAPTPTAQAALPSPPEPSGPSGQLMAGLIMGAISAAALVVGVAIFGMWRGRKQNS